MKSPPGAGSGLHVRLDSAACWQENQWDFWVMPAARPDLRGRPILNLTGVKELDERYAIPADVSLSKPGRVVFANRFSADVQNHLAQGRTVLLLAEEGTLARPRRFTFWAQWIRSTGTFIEDHPALAGFPHDGFCSYQFYRLFGEAVEALNITERGSVEREKLTPIVWGMCGDYDPALKSDWIQPRNRWRLYRHGILCEGRVGGGRVLVCCLRVLDGVRSGMPEAGYLLDCLVDYALSDRPASELPPMTPEEARTVFMATPVASK